MSYNTRGFANWLVAYAHWPDNATAFMESWALTHPEYHRSLASRHELSDATWFELYAARSATPKDQAQRLVANATTPARREFALTHEHRAWVLLETLQLGRFDNDELSTLVADTRTPRALLEPIALHPARCTDKVQGEAAQRLGGYHLLRFMADAGHEDLPQSQCARLLASFPTWYNSRHSRGRQATAELLDRLLDRRPELLGTAVRSSSRLVRLAAASSINLTSPAHARTLAVYHPRPLSVTDDTAVLAALYANPSVDPQLCARLTRAYARTHDRPVSYELSKLPKLLGDRTGSVSNPPEELTDSGEIDYVARWASRPHPNSTTTPRPQVIARLAKNANLTPTAVTLVDMALRDRAVVDALPITEYKDVVRVFTARYHMLGIPPIDVPSEWCWPGCARIGINFNALPPTERDDSSWSLFDLAPISLDRLLGILNAEALRSTTDLIVTKWLFDALGPSVERFDMLVTISENFTGSFGDLIHTCKSLVPTT